MLVTDRKNKVLENIDGKMNKTGRLGDMRGIQVMFRIKRDFYSSAESP